MTIKQNPIPMKHHPVTLTVILFLLTSYILTAQVTQPTNTATPFPEFVGWNSIGSSKPLDIRNDFAGQPINFFTGGTQWMIINGSGGPTAGFVGIGNNFTNPLFQLDVQDNINVNTTGFLNGYRINGFTVLMTPGQENVFVGRGAAANFTGATMGQNTFVGFNAGGSYITSANGAGDRNKFQS